MARKTPAKAAPAKATEAAPQVPAKEEVTAKTIQMDIPGLGKVDVPVESVAQAARELPTAAAKRAAQKALPTEEWKLLAAYRRYSEAVTCHVDLRNEQAREAGMPEPLVLAPGLKLEWAARCETHDKTQLHRSKGAATYAAADSMLWCEGCKENVAAYAKRQEELLAGNKPNQAKEK
jgi:hypothetical protein